jgi:ornithine cyclodeaminase/alanine dehydrogenase-like protein (mu-crystallin family)
MGSMKYTIYARPAAADERLKDRDVLFIDNEIERELLHIDECLEALEDAFREEGVGAAANRSKSVIHVPSPGSDAWHQYVSMEGGMRKLGVVALRLRSHIHVQRTLYGKSRHDFYSVMPGMWGGIVLLFSSEDGSLLAILNDGHIQHLRVGATAALSVKYMARKDAKVLAIFGSGGMAVTHA